MFIGFSVAAGLLALATPTVAQQSPSPAATPPAAEKKTCRRDTPTGSFLPGKAICHTRTEWNAVDRTNGENAQDVLSRRGNWQKWQ